jgi:hypothetical protein
MVNKKLIMENIIGANIILELVIPRAIPTEKLSRLTAKENSNELIIFVNS